MGHAHQAPVIKNTDRETSIPTKCVYRVDSEKGEKLPPSCVQPGQRERKWSLVQAVITFNPTAPIRKILSLCEERGLGGCIGSKVLI